MKDIGMTKNNNHIVELTQDEYNTLIELSLMVSGKTLGEMPYFHRDDFLSSEVHVDLSNAFGVIYTFMNTKDLSLRLLKYLEEINKELDISSKEKDND